MIFASVADGAARRTADRLFARRGAAQPGVRHLSRATNGWRSLAETWWAAEHALNARRAALQRAERRSPTSAPSLDAALESGDAQTIVRARRL